MEPITVSINHAAEALDVGRTKIYEMIADGQLEVFKAGRRTLVVVNSMRRLVAGETGMTGDPAADQQWTQAERRRLWALLVELRAVVLGNDPAHCQDDLAESTQWPTTNAGPAGAAVTRDRSGPRQDNADDPARKMPLANGISPIFWRSRRRQRHTCMARSSSSGPSGWK